MTRGSQKRWYDPVWGQLRPGPLRELLHVHLRAEDAPSTDCAGCQLHCCSYAIEVQDAERQTVTEVAERLGIDRTALFEDRGAGRRLTRKGGACTLLDDAGMCSIHKTSGLAAKPTVCQLFPAIPIDTPSGPRTGLRAGCTLPSLTSSASDVQTYRAVLERAGRHAPMLVAPSAPANVMMTIGADRIPWASWLTWEARAVGGLKQARTVMAGLDDAVAAIDRPERPTAGSERLGPMIGALSTLVGELPHGASAAAAMVAIAAEVPPRRRTEAASIIVAIGALEPLRAPSVLAGLGILRLAAGMVDRDPLAQSQPRESAAAMFRALHHSKVRATLGTADPALLEDLAWWTAL